MNYERTNDSICDSWRCTYCTKSDILGGNMNYEPISTANVGTDISRYQETLDRALAEAVLNGAIDPYADEVFVLNFFDNQGFMIFDNKPTANRFTKMYRKRLRKAKKTIKLHKITDLSNYLKEVMERWKNPATKPQSGSQSLSLSTEAPTPEPSSK